VEGTPFGRYRLLQLLGRGGMGEVWRAYDTATDRMVAVKVLPAHLLDDQIFEQRFRREANAAAALNEPHVVPIHNFGEIDGRLYVDMRLIDGRDLQTLLSEGPLEPARAVTVIEQVAAALNAAHRVGLVHRDVKPSNILIAEFDFAYLIDFGIARTVGETGLTDTGSMIGTWAYMAPERFSTGHIDPRSDTYALACVLHECLTGRQPYPGNSAEQQIAAHLMTRRRDRRSPNPACRRDSTPWLPQAWPRNPSGGIRRPSRWRGPPAPPSPPPSRARSRGTGPNRPPDWPRPISPPSTVRREHPRPHRGLLQPPPPPASPDPPPICRQPNLSQHVAPHTAVRLGAPRS
jgi:serine/threonine protein kinase